MPSKKTGSGKGPLWSDTRERKNVAVQMQAPAGIRPERTGPLLKFFANIGVSGHIPEIYFTNDNDFGY